MSALLHSCRDDASYYCCGMVGSVEVFESNKYRNFYIINDTLPPLQRHRFPPNRRPLRRRTRTHTLT